MNEIITYQQFDPRQQVLWNCMAFFRTFESFLNNSRLNDMFYDRVMKLPCVIEFETVLNY